MKYNTDRVYLDSYFIVKEKSYIKSIFDIFAFKQDGLYGNLFFESVKCYDSVILGCIWTKEMVEWSMYYCDKISEGFTRNLTSSGNTLSVMCLL